MLLGVMVPCLPMTSIKALIPCVRLLYGMPFAWEWECFQLDGHIKLTISDKVEYILLSSNIVDLFFPLHFRDIHDDGNPNGTQFSLTLCILRSATVCIGDAEPLLMLFLAGLSTDCSAQCIGLTTNPRRKEASVICRSNTACIVSLFFVHSLSFLHV